MRNSKPSPHEAAAELLRRRRARRDILSFTKFTFPGYRVDPAHELISIHLDDLVEGRNDRLMIFAPPQHGKSELVSRRLPAYWLGRYPDNPIILTSYSAELAHDMSRDARGIVESDQYRTLFPGIVPDPGSRAVDRWQILEHRGRLVATGAGGSITGRGGLLGIVDDPFKGWEEAQSKTIRDKVWNWWRGTFRTRFRENSRLVLIMTRWHEDDLAGRILQAEGDRWTVVRLPAIAETQETRDRANSKMGLPTGLPDPVGREPGEILCPSLFSPGTIDELRTTLGSVIFNAEYQGAPVLPEGNRFKREWFDGKVIEDFPKPLEVAVRYWDKAATEGGGAYTAGVLIGRKNGLYYVLDVQRGQWSSGTRESNIRLTAELDAVRYNGQINKLSYYLEQEPGSSGVDSAKLSVRNLAGFAVFVDKVTGSKEIRAEPFAAQCQAGNVYLVQGKWTYPFLEELLSFPSGTYKDQVDGASGSFMKIAVGPNIKTVVVDMGI